jgi:TorA maturation chaperone TorD
MVAAAAQGDGMAEPAGAGAREGGGAPAPKPVSLPSSSLLSALAQAFSYPARGVDETLSGLCTLDSEGCCSYAADVEAVLDAARAFADDTQAQLAYTQLFIGSFKMEAPPYASYYLDGTHEVEGPTTAEVRAVYRQFGLQLDAHEHAPADHLRYLVAFEAQLARRFEETGQSSFSDAFEDFADDYLRSWLPTFLELVDAHAEHAYYRLLTRLIADVFA